MSISTPFSAAARCAPWASCSLTRRNSPRQDSGVLCHRRVILGALGIYQYVVDWGGAGATVPLTGFGNTLAKGVREAVAQQGLLGALTGGITATAGGIAAAIFFGFLVALIFKAKPKR